MGADLQDHSVNMKRFTFIAAGGVALLAVAGGIVFYGIAAKGASYSSKAISEKSAQSLQAKIDAAVAASTTAQVKLDTVKGYFETSKEAIKKAHASVVAAIEAVKANVKVDASATSSASI